MLLTHTEVFCVAASSIIHIRTFVLRTCLCLLMFPLIRARTIPSIASSSDIDIVKVVRKYARNTWYPIIIIVMY